MTPAPAHQPDSPPASPTPGPFAHWDSLPAEEVAAWLEQTFRAPLVAFCYGYLGRLEDAEDAVQEVFCRAIRSGRTPDNLRAWLYKIARNYCLNALRNRNRRRDAAPLAAQPEVQAMLTGNLTRLVRGEQRSQLGRLLSRLPEMYQEVLRLRYGHDLSRAEIAELLDLDESVVKSRLFEGLQRLRRDIRPTGG